MVSVILYREKQQQQQEEQQQQRTRKEKGNIESFYDGKWSFHMFQKRRIIKEKTRKEKSHI